MFLVAVDDDLLRRMREPANSRVNDGLVRSLRLYRIPVKVQAFLFVSDETACLSCGHLLIRLWKWSIPEFSLLFQTLITSNHGSSKSCFPSDRTSSSISASI